MRKKVLYFMPDCPIKKDAGNKQRALQLLKYFQSRSEKIDLDFVSEKFWGQWNDRDIIDFKKEFPQFNLYVPGRKLSKKNKIKYIVGYKIPNYIRKYKWLVYPSPLPNNNTHILQRSFNTLLKSKQYDYIIISYVTWATLVENNSLLNNAKLIVDTHDFITAQIKMKPTFKLGKAFEREIILLSVFNEIWSLSADEQYLFSQFVKAEHRFVPLMFNSSYGYIKEDDEYDLLFVGSENEHNIKSINWFFTEVYPILSSHIKICVVGKICNHIPSLANAKKVIFAENVSEYYRKSKIAICPMLSGTGIKVKTVEALSFGLPVVCTLRGLDGLPSKENNGCLRGDTKEEFAKQIHSLLSDKKYYQKIRTQAIDMFNKYFERDEGYRKLDDTFDIA
ncbi:glycosyltransferase [Niabella aquatica]